MLIDEGEKLWRHVLDKTPPPVDGSGPATEWLARRYPEADLKTARELDESHLHTIRQLLEVKEGIAALELIEEKLSNLLKDHLGDAWAGKYKGQPFVTWKTISKSGYEVRPTTYRELRVTAAAKRELRR